MIKIFPNPLTQTSHPGLHGDVIALTCPISSIVLHDELLCGINSDLSTNNFIYYSGYISGVVPNMNISISCIDVVIKNIVKSKGEYLWNGKCFMNMPSPTEVFLPHSNIINKMDVGLEYSTMINNVDMFKIELPPLSSSEYVMNDIGNKSFVTSHIHQAKGFYGSAPETFCSKEHETSIMNIVFKDMDAAYYIKLENLDNVFINDNFASAVGLSSLSKNDLVQDKCFASVWSNIKYMNTIRAIDVSDPTQPVQNSTVSLSVLSNFPHPYDNMSSNQINDMHLSDNNSYYVNDVIMDYMSSLSTTSAADTLSLSLSVSALLFFGYEMFT